MASKIGKREARLREYLERGAKCAAYGYQVPKRFSVVVEWKRSRTWGRNPQVEDLDGNPCLDISGCGYCKRSTAIAQIGAALPGLNPEQRNAIARTGGTGEACALLSIPRTTGGRWSIDLDGRAREIDILTIYQHTAPALFRLHDGAYIRPATPEEIKASRGAREDYLARCARDNRKPSHYDHAWNGEIRVQIGTYEDGTPNRESAFALDPSEPIPSTFGEG